ITESCSCPVPPQNTQDQPENNNVDPKKHSAFRRLRTLTGHDGVINRIAWSPVKNMLASPSFDRSVQIWDVSSRETTQRELIRHHDWVSSVTWSPDGCFLASASSDHTIRIADTRDLQEVGVLRGHSRTVFDVDWSINGLIASASSDGIVIVWNP